MCYQTIDLKMISYAPLKFISCHYNPVFKLFPPEVQDTPEGTVWEVQK